jgi:hypothetical protein
MQSLIGLGFFRADDEASSKEENLHTRLLSKNGWAE